MSKYRKVDVEKKRTQAWWRGLSHLQGQLYKKLRNLPPGLYSVRVDVEVGNGQEPRWTIALPSGGQLFMNG